MAGKRKLTEEEVRVLTRLNEIRDEGDINMFGARPVIAEEFGLDRPESTRLHKLWMEKFDPDGNYAELEIED